MPLDLQPTPQAVVICAVLAPSLERIDEALVHLAQKLGPVAGRSLPYDFDYTSYYKTEMGPGLIKQLVRFEQTVALDHLSQIKAETMALERVMAVAEADQLCRQVNIDPGLVSVEGLVLATTKYSGHRICIAPGLYAETTLLFTKHGTCAPLPWTYPDYQRSDVEEFLLETRATVRQQRS
jgi:hypothetical protein